MTDRHDARQAERDRRATTTEPRPVGRGSCFPGGRMTKDKPADYGTLADRIRSEASIADRPGQMARLEAIAAEVERLKRGAKTLGHIIEQQGRMVLDATGLHDVIGEDGDGDWGYVWESLFDIRAKALQEAELAIIAAAPPINSELLYDGREDPVAAAYIEGFKDAWQIVANLAKEATA